MWFSLPPKLWKRCSFCGNFSCSFLGQGQEWIKKRIGVTVKEKTFLIFLNFILFFTFLVLIVDTITCTIHFSIYVLQCNVHLHSIRVEAWQAWGFFIRILAAMPCQLSYCPELHSQFCWLLLEIINNLVDQTDNAQLPFPAPISAVIERHKTTGQLIYCAQGCCVFLVI